MKQCPVCKSIKGVREYHYGMPREEPNPMKFVSGGCLISDDMPDYKCITCSTDFYKNSGKYHNRFISDGSGINFKCPDCEEWFPALGGKVPHECSFE
jgi:DNA-directed RNA polymerase subunit RPC12/RpoP